MVKYDLNRNIIKVETNEDETRYHYDSNNRLIREDNPLLNKPITYKISGLKIKKSLVIKLEINNKLIKIYLILLIQGRLNIKHTYLP